MDNRRIPLIISLVLGLMVLVGMAFLIVPVTRTTTSVEPGAAPAAATTLPVLPIIILVIILLLGVVMAVTAYLGRARRLEGKAKRDQDMFSVIDDLVQDLAPDEVDYLRGHLRAIGGGQVEESMESLLDQRARDRRAGLRE